MSNYRAKSLESLYEWLANVGTESEDGSTFSFTTYDVADLAFAAKGWCVKLYLWAIGWFAVGIVCGLLLAKV